MRITLPISLICIGVAIASAFTITVVSFQSIYTVHSIASFLNNSHLKDDQQMTVTQDRNMMMQPLAQTLLNNFFAVNVTVNPVANYLGRPALKVAFTDAYQKYYTANNVVQSGAFQRIPLTRFFYEGTIDVDIAAEPNKYADEFTRAFAGVIFRQQINGASDTVYFRMLNGRLNNPQPPADRLTRAIQYIAPPKWEFSNLREEFPGKYETGADIAAKRWNHLRLVVNNQTVSAYVDYATKPALQVSLLGANAPGWIAFFVDDATDAYFSNLRITNKF